jgi:hypothetical protein
VSSRRTGRSLAIAGASGASANCWRASDGPNLSQVQREMNEKSFESVSESPQPALIRLGVGGCPLSRKADREAIGASRRDDLRNAGATDFETTPRQ